MKLKVLILTLLLTVTLFSKEIKFTNIFQINKQMSSDEITKAIINLPNNSIVLWKSGVYDVDYLSLENKKNIRFDFEKDVTLVSRAIYIKSSDNIRFSDFNYSNSKASDYYVHIEDSSNIAFYRIRFQTKTLVQNGIQVKNSKNIVLGALTLKKGIEGNHISIEDSKVFVSECKLYKDYNNSYALVYMKNSDVEIQNSDLSSKYNHAIYVENSRGIIQYNKFNGLLREKSKDYLTAIFLWKSNAFQVNNNQIDYYIGGIELLNSSALIKSNIITNANIGILLDKSKAIIESNSLKNINNNYYIKKNGTSFIYRGLLVRNDSTADITHNSFYNIKMEDGIIFDKDGIGVLIGDKAIVNLDNNTFKDTEQNIIGDAKNKSLPKISINTNHEEFDFSEIIALIDAKVDFQALKVLNPSIVSGELINDLVVNNTIIEANEYMKIDKNLKMICFPREYKGLFVKEMPKLKSGDYKLNIKSKVVTDNGIQQLHIYLKTKNNIKEILYKGKSKISFEKENDLESGWDYYTFSINLKNSKEKRFLSFIVNDNREIVKKFILDDGKIRFVEESDKADF